MAKDEATLGVSGSDAVLAEITMYPLKGAGGCRPEVWPVGPTGLHSDREWMLVDVEGKCVTQLSAPRIALIRAEIDREGVTFAAPDLNCARCPFVSGPEVRPAEVLMEEGEAVGASSVDPRLDEWFSTALRFECRLVRATDVTTRWVDGAVDDGAPLNFQKAFPLHLVTQASLVDLNARLTSPVLMNRFRPNLTISGASPHEDDGWKRVRIGEVVLQIGRACDHRCGVPNIEQETSVSAVEPLKTLATYRRSSKGIYFGQNVTVEAGGELRVGDPVDVLEFGIGLTRRDACTGPA